MYKKSREALGEQAGQVLSPKEEAFAQALFETGCQATAYRQTTKLRKGTKPENIWSSASRLANNAKVVARLEELRQNALAKQNERNAVTLEKVTEYLLESLQLARNQRSAKDIRCAAMDLGKLHGLVVDRSESKNYNVNLSEILRERMKSAKTIDAKRISS